MLTLELGPVSATVETALDRGGWVAFVPDGALVERGRIALTVPPWGGGAPTEGTSSECCTVFGARAARSDPVKLT